MKITSFEEFRELAQRGTFVPVCKEIVADLLTPVSVQMERTARDRNRPLLRTPDPRQRLTELMQLRDPLYRETAHIIMPTEGGSAREVALRILHALADREALE